jgi:hypothetical protein
MRLLPSMTVTPRETDPPGDARAETLAATALWPQLKKFLAGYWKQAQRAQSVSAQRAERLPEAPEVPEPEERHVPQQRERSQDSHSPPDRATSRRVSAQNWAQGAVAHREPAERQAQ